MRNNSFCPEFHTGDNAISIVSHPPEIHPGSLVKIDNPWYGSLCAVQLSDGTIHRWLASFELRAEDSCPHEALTPGIYAIVVNTRGHGDPPHIEIGTRVRIVKCIETIFYDVILSDGEYHKWLAEFELAKPI